MLKVAYTIIRLSSGYPLQSLLDCYQCSRQDEHISQCDLGMPVPPFGCTFCTAPDTHHILAVANEEGLLRLYDTESHAGGRQFFGEWAAHSNAVFDIAWVPGEHKIVTASGDQTARLWDVRAGELIGTCRGHQCSLKSVAFSKYEKAVFCTGGRDGNIMVWDTRCNKKDGFYRQVNQISGAHNVLDKQTPSKLKKKKQTARGLAPAVDSQQSVTVVLFQDEHTLISAGAVDGVVKVWDLRKNYSTCRQEPAPVKAFPYPGASTRKLGYSNLVLDPTGSNLFANCTDDNIYMFNITGLKAAPVAVFSGHQNSTFYIKSSVSPDGQFLLSGSSDHSAYIWKVSECQLPPVLLMGHSQEVTSVAWCPSDFSKIATCSDDNTVRIWRLRRGSDEDEFAGGKANLVGWACQKKPEALPVGAGKHSTPAKIPKVESNHTTSSPIAAACAPKYTGDLPLPTSTPTSSLEAPAPKSQTPARQKEGEHSSPKPESSIRSWVTRTPSSSSPRKALMPVTSQAVASPHAVPPLEKKAKRRLETSREEKPEHKCVKSCSRTTKLMPGAKKSRLDLCFSDGDGEKNQQEDCLSLADASQGCELAGCGWKKAAPPGGIPSVGALGSPSPPFRLHPETRTDLVDKENSSPEKRNWLAAMGEKLRTDKSCSPKSICASPPPSRSPNTTKHQPRNAAPSPPPVPTTPGSMRKICTYFRRRATE
ncbi:denticleless protein homolog isoform X2 [Rhinatrema bivittatum]|uniref:denticleless protein homolog isoform X2 n=1 Tax=Rhinatrema bivittatum TaxID=194408 RepID=UPI00112BFE26|nr:denticleless protein homolog isoform X2 [Rhinatrema bivittatum]